jgi:hypothetical protein
MYRSTSKNSMFSSQTTAHYLPKEHMNLEFVSTTGLIKMAFRGLIIAKNGDVAREENIEFFEKMRYFPSRLTRRTMRPPCRSSGQVT